MSLMTTLGYGFVLYAAAGACMALAFVTMGVDRVMAPASFTPGARLLLLPGAVALWPYVMLRWLKATRRT
jgi:hypothetical protein